MTYEEKARKTAEHIGNISQGCLETLIEEVLEEQKELYKELYNEFIENGLNAGFTDNQLNFMWEFIMMSVVLMLKMK